MVRGPVLSTGATATRASTATRPSLSARRGLRSSSRISGISAASCASFTSKSAMAFSSAAGTSRYALSIRDTRVRAMRSRASLRSSGGSASALSLMTSTPVPPRPNRITGPKVGSSAIPAISSRAFGRKIIGCIVTPVMRAPGFIAFALARMSVTASRTALSVVRFSRTPPTSDLCTMSGDRILTTTVLPSVRKGAAACTDSSASRASTAGTIGIS